MGGVPGKETCRPAPEGAFFRATYGVAKTIPLIRNTASETLDAKRWARNPSFFVTREIDRNLDRNLGFIFQT
jgi:hypothetical protein